MYQTNKLKTYKGRACELALTLIDDLGNQLPTCGLTSAVIRIPNEDGSFIEKAASRGLVFGICESTSIYVYAFTAEEAALFKVGRDMDVGLTIGFGTDSWKVSMKGALTVLNEVF
jgi:hypothetical protein